MLSYLSRRAGAALDAAGLAGPAGGQRRVAALAQATVRAHRVLLPARTLQLCRGYTMVRVKYH